MITGLYITGITVASKLHKSFESYKIDQKTIEKDVKNTHLEVNLTDCSNLRVLSQRFQDSGAGHQEIIRMSNNILKVFEKRWERTQKRWNYT